MKSHRRNSAFGDPLTIAVLALAAGVFLGGWKPLKIFEKKPPVAELTQLQADLAAANAAAAQARAAQAAAVLAERAKHDDQLRQVQADTLGAATSLERVTPEHRTPEVRLAAAMVNRVELKLVAIIGRLPAGQQQEMVLLIDQALSGKQAEIDEANRKLAERDAEFRALTAQHTQAVESLRVKTAEVTQTTAKLTAVQAAVTVKTDEVKRWAAAKDAADRVAGGFAANFWRVVYLLGFLFVGWLFLAFVLPGIVKHLDAGRVKDTLRNLAGYATAPLLFHDAKKKIAES